MVQYISWSQCYSGKPATIWTLISFHTYWTPTNPTDFCLQMWTASDNPVDFACCSNHSSLKDKWSHNEQSSPMGYQVKSGGITRELNKEPLLHCSSIYTTTLWSMLQQYVYLMSIHHASTSCSITYLHVFSLRPPCFLHVPWCHTLNLCCTCVHHVYTMRNPCPLTLSLTLILI